MNGVHNVIVYMLKEISSQTAAPPTVGGAPDTEHSLSFLTHEI